MQVCVTTMLSVAGVISSLLGSCGGVPSAMVMSSVPSAMVLVSTAWSIGLTAATDWIRKWGRLVLSTLNIRIVYSVTKLFLLLPFMVRGLEWWWGMNVMKSLKSDCDLVWYLWHNCIGVCLLNQWVSVIAIMGGTKSHYFSYNIFVVPLCNSNLLIHQLVLPDFFWVSQNSSLSLE